MRSNYKYFNQTPIDDFEKHWHSKQSWANESEYVFAGCLVAMIILAALAIILN